jgi:hypothetical protein
MLFIAMVINTIALNNTVDRDKCGVYIAFHNLVAGDDP